MYLYQWKPNNNGPVLLQITITRVLKQVTEAIKGVLSRVTHAGAFDPAFFEKSRADRFKIMPFYL